MATNLPGLNYDSKLNVDDLSFASDETEDAILNRTTLVFGEGALNQPRYGIVDIQDPNNVISSETTRPLLVYSSTPNYMNINITVGTVVTSNGSIIYNPIAVEDFALARILANDINIVFIENAIIDSPPIRKTRYNTDQYTRRVQNPSVIGVVLLSDFQNSVLFPPSRLANIVVLAVVTVVQSVVTGLGLQFDYSDSAYSFNRPWYSPIDIEHRSKLGSGISTDTNIHGLTYNDLSSGNLTLYDQLLEVGQILARDDSIKGVCGTPCYEVIDPASRLSQDTTGIITSGSRFGGAGTYYITLAAYPVQITAFYLQANIGRDIVWDHIKGTRIVVIPTLEALAFTDIAVIWYTRVYALEPPPQVLTNTLSFSQPNTTEELILTGSIAVSQLTNQFVDFSNAGPIPRNYTIYAKSDGSLLTAPQQIQTVFSLSTVGNLITPISASIFGPAKISVGLAGVNAVPTMQVVVQLTGVNIDDNPITETITFSGTTWQSTPLIENPNQYIISSNVYTAVTAIQIVSSTGTSSNTQIQLWAELETETTLALNKLAKLASVAWSGSAVANLIDQRKISKVIPAPYHRFRAVAEIIGLGGTNPNLVYSEDFATPLLRNTTAGYQLGTNATTRLWIHGQLTAGDYVTFPNGKTVTAVVSSPNRTNGEFAIFPTPQPTRDDLITTLNDSSFLSGYTAVADTTQSDGVLLVTANIIGARGNGSVTVSTYISDYITVVDYLLYVINGLVGGIDTFSECFLPLHMDCINTSIPSSTTYEVTSYRNRYLSVPLPISNNVMSIKVVVHGVPALQTNIQLRVRIANATDPAWLPWQVITSGANGALFTITQGFNISKIQLELFGQASGFSVYEV